MTLTRRLILPAVLGVVSRPRTTLAVCLLVLGGCVVFSWTRLRISTDQNELFSPDAPFFRSYLTFIEKFPENEAIYVVIEAKEGTPPVKRWTGAADEVAARVLALTQHVVSVDARVPLDQLGRQGLLFEDPIKLKQIFEEFKRLGHLIKNVADPDQIQLVMLGPNPLRRLLAALNAGLALEPNQAGFRGFIAVIARSLNETVSAGRLRLPDFMSLDASDPERLGYYYVTDRSDPDKRKRLLLVRVYPHRDFTSLTAISQTVEAIRSTARGVGETYPEFTIRITGRPALEAEEMRTTDRDTRKSEIVALSVVFVGLVIFLRSWWLALAAELALGVGIGWTFGWAALAVGRLNLLSIVFMLALIGIGMDYLVQVLSRYRYEVGRRRNPRLIWVAVFRQVGPPINTACLGAAGAFLVAVLTDFRGAAELGIIAGGGLLLCLLSGYTFLPALLTLVPMRRGKINTETRRHGGERPEISDFKSQRRGNLRYLVTPAIWVILLAAGAPFMFRTGFNPSLLELQAQNLESVRLVRKLETWFVVVMSKDLVTLRAARAAVQDSPVVERTQSVLRAFDNDQWLSARRAELPTINWTEPPAVSGADLANLAQLARTLAEGLARPPATRAITAPTQPADGIDAVEALRAFESRLTGLQPGSAQPTAQLLSQWQKAFLDQVRELLGQFDPEPPDVAKLPREMRGHFLSDDGTYALYIYPREDLWDQEPLGRFVRDVEGRLAQVPGDKVVTGIASNIHHSTSSIRRSFYTSTFYALGLIFVLVLIDMRRLGDTLLAVSVLGLGLPMLVAVMGLLDIDWNFANFFGLPILIGAGHEYGVFMVHRYREVLEDPRRVWRGWDVADNALLLCAFVTSSSFAFFWLLGHHEGLRSLGLVMAVGTVCIYVATVMALRPLLLWRLERMPH